MVRLYMSNELDECRDTEMSPSMRYHAEQRQGEESSVV